MSTAALPAAATLAQVQSRGRLLVLYAAAVAAANTPTEAAQAMHHLERVTQTASELMDRFTEQEQGFEGDFLHILAPVVIEHRGEQWLEQEANAGRFNIPLGRG